ncbi:MAG TPA: NAD(P)-dependent oxidoreductase, partial [Thermoanaerobaculia bacterium]|nr:NAD(P)-dependent oxidoreductase [Thermoanaerobaculia bacterium]
GLGGIGCAMCPRAKAFGMSVVGWSRSLTDEKARDLGIERRESIFQVAAASDVVSVHLALKPETRTMIGEDFFEAMRPGAYFVNTSRAEVVDQSALERAVRQKGIRAGLDVFAGEPAGGTGTVDDPIFQLPGVIGTHHIGASTDQAQEAIASETVRIVREFKETGRAPNVVNLAKKSPATYLLVVRHFDHVGVLAEVFDRIKTAGINVQETENVVFDGAKAAVARIHLNQAPSESVVADIRSATDDILEVTLVPI